MIILFYHKLTMNDELLNFNLNYIRSPLRLQANINY